MMRSLTRATVALTALLATATLVACSSDEDEGPVFCPQVTIPPELASTVVYAPGGGPSEESIRYVAGLGNLQGGCRYEEEATFVDMTVDLRAERGPAYGEGPVEIEYFVAVVDPEGIVLQVQPFETSMDIPADTPVPVGYRQELTQRLPGVSPDIGFGYRVVIGFQIDEAELRARLR